jgi:hypothetical protein
MQLFVLGSDVVLIHLFLLREWCFSRSIQFGEVCVKVEVPIKMFKPKMDRFFIMIQHGKTNTLGTERTNFSAVELFN